MRRLIACFFALCAAGGSAAPPQPAMPQTLPDAVVAAVFKGCDGVVVNRTSAGRFTAKKGGRTVVVEASDDCTVHKGTAQTYVLVEAVVVFRDVESGPARARLQRRGSYEAPDCGAARMRAQLAFNKPNADVCTQAFDTPAPEPVDLVTLLVPAFGSLSGENGALGWQRGDNIVLLAGSATCRPTVHVIEGSASATVDFRLHLTLQDAENKPLGAWDVPLQLSGGECSLALQDDAERNKKVEKALAKIRAEAEALAPVQR